LGEVNKERAFYSRKKTTGEEFPYFKKVKKWVPLPQRTTTTTTTTTTRA
jgi:hypothetical protein